MLKKTGWLALLWLGVIQASAYGRGVTPYLPLNLNPEVEREIERVLILADKPVMTRPIPAAVVLDALPKACAVDAVLCERVGRFLKRYMHGMGLEFASLEGSVSQGKANPVMPNEHGRKEDSHYELTAGAYLQPSDYVLVNAGVDAYEGKATATGSMLSLGFDFAQLDLGYRDHWWSPMTDSSMLISTEAPTMPSATISNYQPLTGLGLQYEMFLAEMSRSDKIELTNGSLTSGRPKFAGLHLSIEPTSGWSLAASRVLIFGGGAAGGQSIGNILDAFFNPSKAQSTGFGTAPVVGKQEAAVSSRFIFPGPIPFAVYFEYAANDTSRGHNYLFGKPDISAGIQFPHLGPFDLTYEIADWEKSWYVHPANTVQTGYLDGITNYGRTIGNWFGDQRLFGDAPGGQTNMVRLGWEPRFGGRFEATLRTLTNASYATYPYSHEYLGSLSYSHPWREYLVGAEVDAGRDVFGEHYTRLAGFLRYGDAFGSSDTHTADGGFEARRADGSELFVDVGGNVNRVQIDLTSDTPRYDAPTSYGPHLGFGARRPVSEHQDLGVRIEADDIRSHTLLAARLLDYRYRFNGPIAIGVFLGAARYALGTPAYGWWAGAGLQWRNVMPGWDLGLDYRTGIELVRQRSLATDPQTGFRPDAFFNVDSVSFYVSRKF